MLLKARRAHQYAIAELALSADGRYAATSSEGGELKVWDLAEGREHALVQAHWQRAGELQITADGRLLVSASLDRWLRVWRLPDLHPVAAFAGEGKIVALATFGDGLTLAVGEATGLVHRPRLEHGDVLFDNGRTVDACHVTVYPSVYPSAAAKENGLAPLGANPLISLVGTAGFELATPCTPCKCATRLRYAPTEPSIIAGAATQAASSARKASSSRRNCSPDSGARSIVTRPTA